MINLETEDNLSREITLETVSVSGACLFRLSDLLDEWNLRAETLHRAREEGRPLGPITGFKGVDANFPGGALPQGLNIMHGSPGVGKTAFALQVACCCGTPALYVTCEMQPLFLMARIAARVTKTFLGKFWTGELHPKYCNQVVEDAITSAPNLYILDATADTVDPQRILECGRDIKAACESEHLLIVVDSVHSWVDGLQLGISEYDAINAGLSCLGKITRALGCSAIGIAERNRQSMTKGGMSGSAGSRKFEYSPESVMELNVDGDAIGNFKPVRVGFPKNRHGTQNDVALLFNGATQTYTESE
ncbi:MAG: DnaB-like helicase C-terminal domain-containing protein [Armatimonadota bacterium]